MTNDGNRDDAYGPQEHHAAAIQRLRLLLGVEHVLTDVETLAAYAQSTSSLGTWPLAIVRPGSTEDVIAVAKVADALHIPLYPISRGKNWGYGDACAVSSGQVIVDLRRMNRILEVDTTLAYAVIEPGVTQQQLSDYLREHNMPLWMDCTGSAGDTSIIGNVLERGFGHSRYGNRFQSVSGFQVVLANGQVLNTGFGHYPHAKTTYVFPYGTGPYLDGLFTQSNMGIVTRVGIWLMPASECINLFLCFIEKNNDIAPVIDALRPLRMDGSLRSILHFGNDLRVISGGRTYPLESAAGRFPLPLELRERLRTENGVGAWNASGAITGTHQQVTAARQSLRKALKGTGAKIMFLNERKLAFGATLVKILGDTKLGKRLSAKVATGKALFDMNKGIPNGRFLAGSYWRRRGGIPADFPTRADPAADNCGILWLSPILPMRGQDVLQLQAIIEPIFEQFKFDLFITYSMVNERALGGVITVAYDKEDTEETARAHACYRALFKAVFDEGYIPYRVGIQSMADLLQDPDVYWSTVKEIKSVLDPNAIISPGRYEPERARTSSSI